MPWLETDPVTERKRFIIEWLSGEFTVAELCRRHEISRKTGYKWIARYEREGPEGLEDRSRRAHDCPWATAPDLIEEAVRIRYSRRQVLGARKFAPDSSRSIPTGTFLAYARCTVTSSVEDWSRSDDAVVSGRTRAGPLHRSMPRTPFGPPTSRASSRPLMVSTATRSPYRTASAATCLAVRVSLAPRSLIPSESSPGSSTNLAYLHGSGPITDPRSLPWLSAVCLGFPSGR